MKTIIFTLLLSISALVVLAQDTTNTSFRIKDYSLRDYVAPDIKYRTLTVGSTMDGDGGGLPFNNFGSNYSGDGQLNLYSYRNNDAFQGSANSSLNIQYLANWSSQDSIKRDSQYPQFIISHNSVNRWYNNNEMFIGVHPNVRGAFDYSNNRVTIDTVMRNDHRERQSISSSVVISVGKGRIQPVTAARKALDILISLEKYNRLSSKPTSDQVDSLAKIANIISYKRFYDGRFKRIYQLAELDKGIQRMGLVDNPDMIYAANLSDIWNFGMTYSRGSGSRVEVGVIPTFKYSNTESNPFYQGNNRQMDYGYGISGVASWLKQVPLNYKWQSDFMVNLDYGIYKFEGQEFNIIVNNRTNTRNSESLSANWSLGYYPNTRTRVQISPFVKFSAVQILEEVETMEPEKDDFFGMATGVDFNSYYYISPRFRLGLNAGSSIISDNYISSVPDYRLTGGYFGQSFYSQTNTSGNNMVKYYYRVNLTYAIF